MRSYAISYRALKKEAKILKVLVKPPCLIPAIRRPVKKDGKARALGPHSLYGYRYYYGWCTGWRAWAEKAPQDLESMTPEEAKAAESKGYYEINLCAEHIARSYIEVAETLLHEMVHLYNLQEQVQDTSRGGFYHDITSPLKDRKGKDEGRNE